MPANPVNMVIQRLSRAESIRELKLLTDAQLLDSFILCREQQALSVLIERHAPMVWAVCLRILHKHHDAEDAFQASFLVLVRRAASIVPRGMVGNWLYGVAYRSALKAKAMRGKRQNRERQSTPLPAVGVLPDVDCNDLQSIIDLELSLLADKDRVVIILCDLQGKTRKEAARELGWLEGTVASRLARARVKLAKRLSKRGLVLSGGTLGTTLSASAACESAPASLMVSTLNATKAIGVTPIAANLASTHVLALTEIVLQSMRRSKLYVFGILLALAAITLGSGWFSQMIETAQPPKEPNRAPKSGPSGGKMDLASEAWNLEKNRLKKVVQKVDDAQTRNAREEALKELEESMKHLRQTLYEENKIRKENLVSKLDFQFKNPRLVAVDIPGKGRKRIWYCWYKVVNTSDQPFTFIPEFELVTGEKLRRDEVIPRVQEQVRGFEDPSELVDLKNSVTIASQPIPSAKQGGDQGIAGIAIWEELDKDAKNFTLVVAGLSNEQRVEKGSILRKVLQLRFERTQNELQLVGSPEWVDRVSKMPK
jgi:RNA polymerase sigma factor (sigma-70 family)